MPTTCLAVAAGLASLGPRACDGAFRFVCSLPSWTPDPTRGLHTHLHLTWTCLHVGSKAVFTCTDYNHLRHLPAMHHYRHKGSKNSQRKTKIRFQLHKVLQRANIAILRRPVMGLSSCF